MSRDHRSAYLLHGSGQTSQANPQSCFLWGALCYSCLENGTEMEKMKNLSSVIFWCFQKENISPRNKISSQASVFQLQYIPASIPCSPGQLRVPASSRLGAAAGQASSTACPALKNESNSARFREVFHLWQIGIFWWRTKSSKNF